MMLKTPGIPMWVTIWALILFVFGCVLGGLAISGQALEMDPLMNVSWGGRQLGLGLAAAVAVFLKSPTAYIAAFVGGVGRDVGDLIGHLAKPDAEIGALIGILVFLLAGILGAIAAYKARNLRISADEATVSS